ncbi:TetR family transcriptional regulator [Reinekea blandensis]|uniref:Transcriptional regulator tetR family protein n=1 Tax=Reinekea blandensis MED297 TaxID=314283 RepID=A4BE74_9GAMM|nr:TetR family transcriptional regulator [Reinekea blandensis]EAR09552.1 transcriptional regulator tetR family protein [Reinekea blandensis MED297]
MSLKAESSKRPVGRKATISQDDIIAAALRLAGPHRSISALSLREITREAGIAPNSFYRHFRDTEELAVSVIDLAGRTLRNVIGQARGKARERNKGIVRMSVETFIDQLHSDGNYLPTLLREGVVGSDRFKDAVRQQLDFFEQELTEDLIAFAQLRQLTPDHPDLIARAITRLVFAMGAEALDKPRHEHPAMIDDMVIMIKMLITGAYALNSQK